MIKKLVKALKEDGGYREGWKANIAMAFVDEYDRTDHDKVCLNRHDIHEIANRAADNFLNLLTS